MKLMNVRTFVRGGYLSAVEAVQVIRGTEVLGVWSPFLKDRDPAPRPGPENPPAENGDGDVRTQAQIGAPDADPVRGGTPAPLAPRAIVPPMPAGYVHDPNFNAKGSRAVPKVRK